MLEESASGTLLVAPIRTYHPWYLLLLNSLIGIPVLLPQWPAQGPLWPTPPTKLGRVEGFQGRLMSDGIQARLQTLLQQAGAQEPTTHTCQHGQSGGAGACMAFGSLFVMCECIGRFFGFAEGLQHRTVNIPCMYKWMGYPLPASCGDKAKERGL